MQSSGGSETFGVAWVQKWCRVLSFHPPRSLPLLRFRHLETATENNHDATPPNYIIFLLFDRHPTLIC